MIGLTIPTRGTRGALLEDIVMSCGLERDKIVIVRTQPCDVPDGVVVIDDFGPINIHRWWNTGLDKLQEMGVRYGAVLNDDLIISPDSLHMLAQALATSGYTLAMPSTGERVGWAWMLDLTRGVRPDESYRWWYGDDQLIHDAMENGGVTYIPGLTFVHMHPNHATGENPVLLALAMQDRVVYDERVSKGLA